MAKKKAKSLSEAVSAEVRSSFDLNKFKNKKGLDKKVRLNSDSSVPGRKKAS